MRSRIGVRLVISIILFSSCIALAATALQIHSGYREDLAAIEGYAEIIETSHLESLTNSVWVYDEKQIRLQLEALLGLPDMEHLRIESDVGSVWSAGEIRSRRLIRRAFPLTYRYRGSDRTIGLLEIAFSLDKVYRRLFHETLAILIRNAVFIFLVSGFTLLIFQFLVTRHLTDLAHWLNRREAGESDAPFRLRRRAPGSGRPDELDQVVDAINQMRGTLRASLAERVRSEAKYRLLSENVPLKIFHKDKAFRYVACNRNFAADLGLTPEAVEGRTDRDLFSADLAEKHNRDDAEVLESGTSAATEETQVGPDGRKRFFHTVRTPILDDRGGISGILGAALDLSELKAAERELRESHALLNAIIDGTTDAIFLKDLEGRYLLANRAACEAMGSSLEEVIGKTDTDLFPPASAAVIHRVDGRVIAGGRNLVAEEELITVHGPTHWLANKTPFRDEEGNIRGLIGISRNITDLKRIEAEKAGLETRLRQSQRLESIGTLAGGIAHDFNNILAAVIGYADMALDEIRPTHPAHQMIAQVLKASNRAKDLVQHILMFSRKAEQKLGPVHVSTVVGEALTLLRATTPATIRIDAELDSGMGVILADPTQIHQIVMNLCTNAAQALEETGGRIHISVADVDLAGEDLDPAPGLSPGPHVALTFKDSGPGVDPAHIDKIFDPYFTTKEVGKGSGMGLAVVHGIVQSHGGMITVESAPGEGTTFRICFPRMASAAPEALVVGETLPTGDEHILLVDDESMLVEIGTEMLTRLGYTVTGMEDSLAALAAFKAEPKRFDLVITDQTMPNLTGSELATAMLEIDPEARIILCTGHTTRIDEAQARRMGIRAFLLKPLVKGEIARLIRSVLDAEMPSGCGDDG